MNQFALIVGILIGLLFFVQFLVGDKRRGRQRSRRTSPQSPSSHSVNSGLATVISDIIWYFGRRKTDWTKQTVPINASDLPPPTPMPDIEVVCPICKNVLVAPAEMAGQDATCEGCRSIVHVPPLKGSENESEPSSIFDDTAPTITIELLHQLEWRRLEEVTQAYFDRTGWRTEQADIGPDGGVDIRLFAKGEDNTAAVVQCKAWTNRVGVKPVRELFGVMASESIPEGYFVTSGHYSDDAQSFAQGKKLTLIDGAGLVERIMMLSDKERHSMYDIATEGDYKTPTCPTCGKKMVRRIGTKGRGAGLAFWGCPAYPRCKAILHSKSDEE